jgi:CRP-like cAMP-binding protein
MIKFIDISEEILIKYGATEKFYKKGDYVARTSSYPKQVLYILSGKVKICDFNDEGVEYLHGYCNEGELLGAGTYFAESSFYNDFIADENIEARELSLINFEKMIAENPDISRAIMKYLATIIEIKTITLNTVLGKSPREKILFTLDKIKKVKLKNMDVALPYTRQEIANYLGLRVETVIRTVKELEDEGLLRIEKGKIFY